MKHVHVIGIGGSAMAPLAGMLRERGFRVTGSDSGVYPPASTLLETLGISFFNTFDATHLEPAPDLVVIGNIIARGNPELEEVLDRKISSRISGIERYGIFRSSTSSSSGFPRAMIFPITTRSGAGSK